MKAGPSKKAKVHLYGISTEFVYRLVICDINIAYYALETPCNLVMVGLQQSISDNLN